MPVIQITSKPTYYPFAAEDKNRKPQKMVIQLARDLPGLFVSKTSQLHMEPGTPKEGVQVTHCKFHAQDVNVPDVWIYIQFSEADLTKKQRIKVVRHIKKMILAWFAVNDCTIPENLACDVAWGPTHGFLRFNDGNLSLNW